ncbi:MAG: hypothetical protein KDC46_12935 [Thermoleophilia bacterium]|nr:hypothetical protein [Thermoleophilia bacterium]
MSGPALIDVDRDPDQVAVGRSGDDDQRPGARAGESSYWTFVRWLLGAAAGAMLVIGVVNWVVDPTGVTGRTTRWQVADNSAVRSAKLDLYEAALKRGDDPQIVLLGSSRTMKFDPAVVQELTGERAFNAAVSGGVPRDAWLFVQYMREQQEEFPHLVWGLDADAFRGKQLREGLSTDPRMAKFVPWQDRLATKVSSLGTLTEWQTTDATIRSLRAGGNADATGAARFSPDGMQLFSRDYETRDVLRNRAIRRQTTNYANFVFGRDGWEHVEQGPLDDFESVVRTANEQGDVPTIFITPYHPIAEAQLAEHDLAGKRAEVLDELRSLQRGGDLEFELVDLSDPASFDADPREWYDGVHITPVNTERALRLLDRQGLLAAP